LADGTLVIKAGGDEVYRAAYAGTLTQPRIKEILDLLATPTTVTLHNVQINASVSVRLDEITQNGTTSKVLYITDANGVQEFVLSSFTLTDSIDQPNRKRFIFTAVTKDGKTIDFNYGWRRTSANRVTSQTSMTVREDNIASQYVANLKKKSVYQLTGNNFRLTSETLLRPHGTTFRAVQTINFVYAGDRLARKDTIDYNPNGSVRFTLAQDFHQNGTSSYRLRLGAARWHALGSNPRIDRESSSGLITRIQNNIFYS
jgi:hypothetical protein